MGAFRQEEIPQRGRGGAKTKSCVSDFCVNGFQCLKDCVGVFSPNECFNHVIITNEFMYESYV